MANGMVRTAICSVVTEFTFSKESDRWKVAKQEVAGFLQKLSNENRLTEFESFAVAFLKLLEKHLETACTSSSIHSRSVQKEKHGLLSIS